MYLCARNICSGNWDPLKWCSVSDFFSSSSLTYDPSSRFRSTPPLPNLFCHVTPLIGWHVINSLACTAGCHLHGNKSLPLNVGGGKRTRLCASLQQTSPFHPYQLSYSNLLGLRSVIFISRWQTELIEYRGSFLWMLLMGELQQIKFFWWLTSINPTVHLGPLFICPYKPSVIHYWVISFLNTLTIAGSSFLEIPGSRPTIACIQCISQSRNDRAEPNRVCVGRHLL